MKEETSMLKGIIIVGYKSVKSKKEQEVVIKK